MVAPSARHCINSIAKTCGFAHKVKIAIPSGDCSFRAGGATVETTKPTILILTALTGGGHLSLALALQDILSEDYETHIVDPQPGIFRQYYTYAGRHSSRLWGLGYKYSDNEKAALRLHKTLTLLVQQRLYRLTELIKPRLIITTHTLYVVNGEERRCLPCPNSRNIYTGTSTGHQ